MVFQRTSPLIADPNPIEAVSVVSVITSVRASGLMTLSPSGHVNKITSLGTGDNCCNAFLYYICFSFLLFVEANWGHHLSFFCIVWAPAIRSNVLKSKCSLFNSLNKYLTSNSLVNTLVLVFQSPKPSWFYPPSLCLRCCSSSWQTWQEQQRWSRCGEPHTPQTDHSSPTEQNSTYIDFG